MRKLLSVGIAAAALVYAWWTYSETPQGVLMRAPGVFYSKLIMIILTAGVAVGAVYLLAPGVEHFNREVAAARETAGEAKTTSDYLQGAGWFFMFNLIISGILALIFAFLWRGSDKWVAGLSSLVLGPTFLATFYKNWTKPRRHAVYIGYFGAMVGVVLIAWVAQTHL